jgi:hypothetical protein
MEIVGFEVRELSLAQDPGETFRRHRSFNTFPDGSGNNHSHCIFTVVLALLKTVNAQMSGAIPEIQSSHIIQTDALAIETDTATLLQRWPLHGSVWHMFTSLNKINMFTIQACIQTFGTRVAHIQEHAATMTITTDC